MPSLRSCGLLPLDGETSVLPSALHLQLLLLCPPLATISLHPPLLSLTPWKKGVPKPCPNHKESSSCHSCHRQSLPLTLQRNAMWLVQRFEARAPPLSPASHPSDLLLYCGYVAASAWQQTRRSVHTRSRRT